MPSKQPRFSLEDINANQLYSMQDLADRGMSKWFLRTARRRGLTVRYYGRHGFVLGNDLIEFLIASDKRRRDESLCSSNESVGG